MTKLNLSDVSNLMGSPTSAANTINANNALIEAAISNTLSRDGTTPNEMLAQLDMNNNEIINVGSPKGSFSAVRWIDLVNSTALPTTLVMPSLVGNAGKFLSNDGTSLNWRIPSNLPSVKDFGAIGDGIVDDTVAIQNAVNTVKGLYFPEGTYKISSPITITSSGCNLSGAGKTATTIAPNFAAGDAFTIGKSGGMDTVSIRGMTIKPTVTKTSGAAIRTIEVANIITLDDLYIYGGYDGIVFEGNATNTSVVQHLSNFFIRDCTGSGIRVGGGAGMVQDVFIYCGNVSNCGSGIKLINVSGLFVHDVDIVLSTTTGIWFTPSSGQTVIFGFFSNVLADSSGTDGWLFGSSGGIVANITCVNCWSAASGGHGTNHAAAVYGMSWTGGIIRNNVGHGVSFIAGGKITYSSAQIFNNSRNILNAYDGVYVGSGVTDVEIRGCLIGAGGYDYAVGGINNQRYGVNLVTSTSTANIVITDNNLTGNSTGTLFDGMTLASKVIRHNLGYQNRNSGTASVLVANAAIAVPHGLAQAPVASNIQITPISSPGASGVSGWWFDSINSTQFVIRTSQVVATQPLQFSWEAKLVSLE